MSGFLPLSRAMLLGFLRDRAAVFFTVLFPLMFLLLLGTLFQEQGAPRLDVFQVGAVPVLDQIPGGERGELGKVLRVEKTTDRAEALAKVRAGDADGMVEQSGSDVVVHYSAADLVRAGTLQGLMKSIVQNANLAAAGVSAPAFTLLTAQVEDESLKPIQYLTSGLLGWAIAVGATFGAAMTLVNWRQKKILRRLRLAPVQVAAVVGARVAVSVVVAMLQLALFLGVATLPYFGLRLTDAWWMAIPLVMAGTLAFLSIGVLAGSFARTPEAASAIANLIVLPMAFLSGAFFPLESAPGWLSQLSQVFPLRHLVLGMQDVLVRGQGPASALPAIGVLAAFAVVFAGLSAWVFRWDDV